MHSKRTGPTSHEHRKFGATCVKERPHAPQPVELSQSHQCRERFEQRGTQTEHHEVDRTQGVTCWRTNYTSVTYYSNGPWTLWSFCCIFIEKWWVSIAILVYQRVFKTEQEGRKANSEITGGWGPRFWRDKSVWSFFVDHIWWDKDWKGEWNCLSEILCLPKSWSNMNQPPRKCNQMS